MKPAKLKIKKEINKCKWSINDPYNDSNSSWIYAFYKVVDLFYFVMY